MLNQIGDNLFLYFFTYLPNILAITFNIVLLVFAILIYKRNSYNYGITLMISSILSLALNIIYISIRASELVYLMYTELGIPLNEVVVISFIVSIFFLSLNTTSAMLLVVSICLIYKTHKKDRID